MAWNESMPQDNGQQLGERDAKADPRRKRVYRLAQDEDLSGEKAPRYAGKQVSISTTFDRKNGDGVIVAQGGDKQGYALYIRDGRLVLGVRDHWKLTEAVSGEPLDAGVSDVVATIGRKGEMEVFVDGKLVAKADAACVLAQAGDGLQVGTDKIKPVGKYSVTTFQGSIDKLEIKFD